MKLDHLIWKEQSRKKVFTSPVFSVRETLSLSPRGEAHPFTVIDARDWAIVVPVLERDGLREFVMVRQWRHGSDSLSLEFPGGVLEKGENEEDGAKRELREETGYTTENIIKLGEFSPNPAIMSNKVHVFLARDLRGPEAQELDDDEYVDIERVREEEVFKNMGRPPFIHALMATALFLYREFGRQGCQEGPARQSPETESAPIAVSGYRP